MDDYPSSSDPEPDFKLRPSPDLPPPTVTDQEDRMRISHARKRKERERFCRLHFGSADVDKVGCIKGIRIKEDDDIDTIGVEIHSDDSQERFLKRIGAVMYTDFRPPSEPPTAEQIKRDEAERAKQIQKAKRALELKKKAYNGIPLRYWLLNDIKGKPFQYGIVTKCASLAIQDYNLNAGTNYRLVDLDRVGWNSGAATYYYIIFDAISEGKKKSFEAEVHHHRIDRRKNAANSVECVRMRRRGSKWYPGTLRELVKSL